MIRSMIRPMISSMIKTMVNPDSGTINLWNDPPSVVGSDWIDNGGGNYTYTGDGSFNQLQDDGITEVGEDFLVTFDVISISGEMRLATGSTHGTFNSIGSKSVPITADGVNLFFARSFGVVSCTMENIKVVKTS